MISEFLTAKTFGPFNSREIAAVIWSACFFVWVIRRAEVHKTFTSLVKAALHLKLLALYSLPICWSALSVWLLAATGFWKLSLLKDTIFWTLFSGIALVGRSLGMRESTDFFRQMIKDTLAITVIFEFLMNLYTFELWGELLLVPFGAFLAIAEFVVIKTPKIQALKVLYGCLQSFIGLLMIGFLAWSLYYQSQQAFSIEAASQLIIPILLSLLSIPMVYFIALISSYEQLMVSLSIGKPRSFAVKFYGGLKLIDHLRINLNQALSARRRFSLLLNQASTHDEIDAVFAKDRDYLKNHEGGIEAMKRRSKERTAVRVSSIRMPHIPLFQKPWEAAEFVLNLGLKDTLENEPPWRYQDDEWYSLAQLEIETELSPNFKIGGATITCMHSSQDEAYLESVRWSAYVFNPEAAHSTTVAFRILCRDYLTVLGCPAPYEILGDVPQTGCRKETNEAVYEVTYQKEKFGYAWKLQITTKFNFVAAIA